MLEEYVLVPDIFDRTAYSDPAFIDMCLPHIKEPLLQEALVRDLRGGGWSRYCLANSGSLHRLTKEIIRKLIDNNRLCRFPAQTANDCILPADWCQEALNGQAIRPLSGVIAAHKTKQHFSHPEVASIEKLTGTLWWQCRSPSVRVDRKTSVYLTVLDRILRQANSLMFIDPNLDPGAYNYREFIQLLRPLAARQPRPQIELHRSLCRGDGPGRTFPSEPDWRVAFSGLDKALKEMGLSAEVFFWEDFHPRYLITNIAGLLVEAGFDVTGQQNDETTWARLGRADRDEIQRRFDPSARAQSFKWRFPIGRT